MLEESIQWYICFVITLRAGCLCLLAQRLKAGVTVGVWCFQWHHTPTQLQRCTISLLTTMLIKADIVIILLYRPDVGAGAADGRLCSFLSFLPCCCPASLSHAFLRTKRDAGYIRAGRDDCMQPTVQHRHSVYTGGQKWPEVIIFGASWQFTSQAARLWNV